MTTSARLCLTLPFADTSARETRITFDLGRLSLPRVVYRVPEYPRVSAAVPG